MGAKNGQLNSIQSQTVGAVRRGYLACLHSGVVSRNVNCSLAVTASLAMYPRDELSCIISQHDLRLQPPQTAGPLLAILYSS